MFLDRSRVTAEDAGYMQLPISLHCRRSLVRRAPNYATFATCPGVEVRRAQPGSSQMPSLAVPREVRRGMGSVLGSHDLAEHLQAALKLSVLFNVGIGGNHVVQSV